MQFKWKPKLLGDLFLGKNMTLRLAWSDDLLSLILKGSEACLTQLHNYLSHTLSVSNNTVLKISIDNRPQNLVKTFCLN